HAGAFVSARLRRTWGQTGLLWIVPGGGGDRASRGRVALACWQAPRDEARRMAALLSVDGVSKRVRGLLAVDELGLGVARASILPVIGPNGAGKTTLFNIIAGMFAPDRGSVAFAGERIDSLPPDEICRRGIGRTFQLVRPFPALTVQDNVVIGAMLRRRDPAAARRHAHDVLP